ncbi:hypothetical protein [Neobacillus drentensis]|uniref:hypothetical protein n=1 Tax=Neobacillus drentensis TaxID=220684 RepID=UPI000825A166|nr:hypothetical protein [Neobacillus drentensis]
MKESSEHEIGKEWFEFLVHAQSLPYHKIGLNGIYQMMFFTVGRLLYDEFGSLVLLYACIFICGFALICFGTFQRLQYSQKEVSNVKVNK